MIKWSAVRVSEAMVKVEEQVNLADSFITEAREKARVAKGIPDLPDYLDQRISRLIDQIDRIKGIRDAIEAVRKDIPDGAIEAERERTRHGSKQSMM